MATSNNKQTEEMMNIVKESNTNKVKLAVTDIDGILRGKLVSTEKFMSIAEGGFGFCDVVFGWDAADVAYDNTKFTGWHSGYPDAPAQIDPSTVRKIPWEQGLPMVLADFGEAYVCPRSLLKKIHEGALSTGIVPAFSQEFEWFNFEETPQELHDKGYSGIRPLTPGMFGYSILRSSMKSTYFQDLFNQLEEFGIPIEGLHTETGPGVYEAAIKYSDILTAADRAVLFKTGVKEIAYRHGYMASFMAKWNVNYPGCSGHIHQSLWDADGTQNLFHDENGQNGMSRMMEQYIAGQLHCLPHILPMYAPNINSYKRLVEGAWAPTTLTWGLDNRTTALRALPGSDKSTRLETRVAGSDANPYLGMAAALASGLYGIRKELKLNQEPTKGNGYLDKSNGVLPDSLQAATEAMAQSEIAQELFGEDFVDHFVSTRRWEHRQFAPVVTDWELKRYFEII
ncbi:MAG: glutamine synthetase family protein [Cyclobacteriaceae bacterium]|nr:glutamine synthetase family protein [Cyclobacteriaceae bacterium]